ncbi:MAG: transposase [Erysipelotrichaceae bacterium]|nr:transposase [Erysipelotrichaceae bacterium]
MVESINNTVSIIIKVTYGYHNFERFRKRCMLISRYKKI